MHRSTHDFNPRPPRGGRHGGILDLVGDYAISIHAPREGGDCVKFSTCARKWEFQSTPPARGATYVIRRKVVNCAEFQSTPPARGATCRQTAVRYAENHFNPRPPRGGRRLSARFWPTIETFQSTPPARGATYESVTFWQSIEFQSTPPARGATFCRIVAYRVTEDISIHAPREGGDNMIVRVTLAQ